jgi:hypothetical protein
METLPLNLESKNEIIAYRDKNHLVQYEYRIFEELINTIENADLEKIAWFRQFGDAVRCITMNVHAYRKGLEFGFTEIAFDQHGWFKRPQFLDKENLIFGNPDRYSEHSIIYLGRGANHVWTYAVDYNFGTAGGGYHLSVYGKQFKSREDALSFGLNDLNGMMTDKLNNSDTSNYKQPIILATLKDISKAQVNLVQMSLF